MAFFPCIYFCESNSRLFRFEDRTYRYHSHAEAVASMLERSRKRQYFWELALKMFAIADTKGLRMIVENPYSPIHYLVQYFPYRAALIDKNRAARGDFFVKPTQFFFINCDPTRRYSEQKDKEVRSVWKAKGAPHSGLCSEVRSMISPDYARNFICDNILGKPQPTIHPTLF